MKNQKVGFVWIAIRLLTVAVIAMAIVFAVGLGGWIIDQFGIFEQARLEAQIRALELQSEVFANKTAASLAEAAAYQALGDLELHLAAAGAIEAQTRLIIWSTIKADIQLLCISTFLLALALPFGAVLGSIAWAAYAHRETIKLATAQIKSSPTQ